MRVRTVVGMAAALVLLGSGAVLSGMAGADQNHGGVLLPPPGSQTYTGVLDPVFWRADPPQGRTFKSYERWAINKDGRAPVWVEVVGLVPQANALANKKVRVFGRYKTVTNPEGVTVRFLKATEIQAVE